VLIGAAIVGLLILFALLLLRTILTDSYPEQAARVSDHA
jgi:putative effector of murein hydrolase LrgA (UPF0299 family)